MNWAPPSSSNGFESIPDITGDLTGSDLCTYEGNEVTLQATVCNRGQKSVGAAMPATFYSGDVATGEVLCVSYTDGPVPTGGCKVVSCTFTSDDVAAVSGLVTMVVNDDGAGNRTTLECNYENNTDSTTLDECKPLR